MAEKKKKKKENGMESTIFYPEFVPSVFSWVSIEDQKERSKYIEELGKDKTQIED